MRTQALLKIEAAARKAALASNSKLREADDALAESQKALGTNAVHLHLLTGASTGGGGEAVFQCSALARGVECGGLCIPRGTRPGGRNPKRCTPQHKASTSQSTVPMSLTLAITLACSPTSCTHTQVQT